MQNLIIKSYVKTTMAIAKFKKDQQGVTAIEYSLIGAAVAAVVVAAMVAFEPALRDALNELIDALGGTEVGATG